MIRNGFVRDYKGHWYNMDIFVRLFVDSDGRMDCIRGEIKVDEAGSSVRFTEWSDNTEAVQNELDDAFGYVHGVK